jgi:hypothetical protein
VSNWQPVIDQLAVWLAWGPWKWLLLALIVWHVMIGRANAVRWCESLGWNGALGLLTRVGWVQQPPPPRPAEVTLEQAGPLEQGQKHTRLIVP